MLFYNSCENHTMVQCSTRKQLFGEPFTRIINYRNSIASQKQWFWAAANMMYFHPLRMSVCKLNAIVLDWAQANSPCYLAPLDAAITHAARIYATW